MRGITDHQAKYFAWELTRRRRGGDLDRIAQSLFDAAVDLNPHQIDAAVFALRNPLSKGVIFADEVGLGKTIEAALVLCQNWAERKRRLLVLCPASLRKQWAQELNEKFSLPTQVLDAKAWRAQQRGGVYNPLDQDVITIMSINFASAAERELTSVLWDLVVIDEAHKLRNAYRDSNVIGQSLKRALAGTRKLLLTATPLQNSLIELFGLSTLIDEQLFGDKASFRSMYMRGDSDVAGLRRRLSQFTQRTLRKDVLEYVPYTQRKALTVPFEPGEDERRLYELVSDYLMRGDCYGVPHRQRHLVGIIVRKLLASSSEAVVATLEVILVRLRKLRDKQSIDEDWLSQFIEEDELDEDALDDELKAPTADTTTEQPINVEALRGEIAELEHYLVVARGIREDQKSYALLTALQTGFLRMLETGAARKAVIFTESRRTQDYLLRFLESHGYAGKVATFSGGAGNAASTGIYQRWLAEYAGSDRVTGSPAIDRRTAIIDHFRAGAEILICTEAGAEGINLQFCSLVVNYDLPWNPQRVEQRIGRCHRYGQKHDVVVINFLNQHNAADQRVLELLTDKFQLFDGVFGASDEILGRIESGVDLERRIAEIYDTCRTPAAIDAAFAALRAEMEQSIGARMRETEAALLENFDASILDKLKVHKEHAEQQLDRISRMFWQLTKHQLVESATFDSQRLAFDLVRSPIQSAPPGRYQLIRKGQPLPEHGHVYRLTHPLGEFVLDNGRRLETPVELLNFSLAGQKISVLQNLGSKCGWLELNLLELSSFQLEEHLVFTACTDDGQWLDIEACEHLMTLVAESAGSTGVMPPDLFYANVRRQCEATLARALDENDQYFQREREKLDQWADDQIKAAEQELADTKARIKDAQRRARLSSTIEEQASVNASIKLLEAQQRRQRQQIFDVEDAIAARRDALIDALQKRLNQSSHTVRLFRIRWQLR